MEVMEVMTVNFGFMNYICASTYRLPAPPKNSADFRSSP
jgi:hypothetical protein